MLGPSPGYINFSYFISHARVRRDTEGVTREMEPLAACLLYLLPCLGTQPAALSHRQDREIYSALVCYSGTV